MKGDDMTDDEFQKALGDKRESLGLDRDTGRPHVVHIAWESGGETFAMSIQRGYERESLRTLCRWMADPGIMLCWRDAKVIRNQIRRAFR